MTKSNLKSFHVNLPEFVTVLDEQSPVISHVTEAVKKHTKGIKTVDGGKTDKVFAGSPYFSALEVLSADEDTGIVTYNAVPHDDLFYRLITECTEKQITNQGELLAWITDAVSAKREYEKLRGAITEMEQTGYGVVTPTFESFKLEKPVAYKSGKTHGVKFRVCGTGIHMVRVDVNCEVAPIIGEAAQSDEMLKYLLSQYDTNPTAMWETPIFGKSLESIVREDIAAKSSAMPTLAKTKIQKTVGRIVNNGTGGVICILL
jgi:stage IV sporulation protein A